MPEGDIVQRVARRFTELLTGHGLIRGELRWPSLGAADLAGARIVETMSVGKHLLTRLDDGRTLRTHLRMDGYWRIHPTAAIDAPSAAAGGLRSAPLAPVAAGPADSSGGKSTRPAGARRAPRPDRAPSVRCVLATAEWTFLGHHLGKMNLVRTSREADLIGHLGPDLLDPALNVPAAAARILAQGYRPIGEVLLDQTVVCGAGTIYLAETLWRLHINPWDPAGALGQYAGDIVATAAALLARSVAAPTPTATGRTNAVPTRGQLTDGAATLDTYVHGREGRGCLRCGNPIAVGEVGPPTMRRPAFYCPACQPRR